MLHLMLLFGLTCRRKKTIHNDAWLSSVKRILYPMNCVRTALRRVPRSSCWNFRSTVRDCSGLSCLLIPWHFESTRLLRRRRWGLLLGSRGRFGFLWIFKALGDFKGIPSARFGVFTTVIYPHGVVFLLHDIILWHSTVQETAHVDSRVTSSGQICGRKSFDASKRE